MRLCTGHTRMARPAQAPLLRALLCFHAADNCDGVLFCAQTRDVLRRIQPVPDAPAAAVTPELEAQTPQSTPDPHDDAAGLMVAAPAAEGAGPAGLDREAIG